MQFLCLIYSDEAKAPQYGTPEFGELLQAYGAFSAEAGKAGVLEMGQALQPVATAKTVANRNGKLQKSDGPHAKTDEQLGGIYLLNCDDHDQALEYAGKIPTAKYGRVEVRPVMVFDRS